MSRRTVCMFPVVGYQAHILEKIGDFLIEQGVFDKVLFLCPSVSSYNALNKRYEKLLLPEMISAMNDVNLDTNAMLPAYEEIKFQEELKYGLVKTGDWGERLKEANRYSVLWQKILKDQNIDCVLMWNGYILPQQQFVNQYKKNSPNIFYLENGYEPRTFIIDQAGINAKSGFPSVITDQNLDINGVRRKVDTHSVKHESATRLFNYLMNQMVAFYFKRVLGIQLRYEYTESIAQKIKKFIYKKVDSCRIPYSIKLENKDFVFFPLQVVTDSQLLDNSIVKQDQAILYTAKAIKKINETRSTPLYLVVKEHPRQECHNYLDRLRRVLDYRNIIFIRNGDISYLVERCKAIVTINSSVGYLGLKRNKPVIAFGKSIYVRSGLVRNVENDGQLHNLLLEILRNPTNYYSSEEKERFIGLYQSYCYSISDNSFQRAAQYIVARLGGRP